MAVTTPGVETDLSICTIHNMAAGSFVVLRVEQRSGGPLNIKVNPDHTPEFMMVKLP
jgi:hypothetical protein